MSTGSKLNWAYIFFCVLQWTVAQVFEADILFRFHIDVILLLLVLVQNWQEEDFRRSFISAPIGIWGLWTLYSIINWFVCPFFADTADQHAHWYWHIFSIAEAYCVMAILYYEASIDFRRAIKLLFYVFAFFLVLGLFGQGNGPDKSDMASWEGRSGTLLGNHFPLAMLCSLSVAAIASVCGLVSRKQLIIWTCIVTGVVLWVATRKAMLGIFVLGVFYILASMEEFSFKNILLLLVGGVGLYFAYNLVMDYTLIGQRINEMDEMVFDANVPVWLEFLGDRAMHYVLAWNIFLDHPINGIGLGNSMNYTQLAYPLHTEYMEHLCEGGIIGAGLYLAFIGSIIKNIIKVFYEQSKQAAIMCTGGLAMILFISLTAWVYNMPHFFVVYAIIIAYCKPLVENNTPSDNIEELSLFS